MYFNTHNTFFLNPKSIQFKSSGKNPISYTNKKSNISPKSTKSHSWSITKSPQQHIHISLTNTQSPTIKSSSSQTQYHSRANISCPVFGDTSRLQDRSPWLSHHECRTSCPDPHLRRESQGSGVVVRMRDPWNLIYRNWDLFSWGYIRFKKRKKEVWERVRFVFVSVDMNGDVYCWW